MLDRALGLVNNDLIAKQDRAMALERENVVRDVTTAKEMDDALSMISTIITKTPGEPTENTDMESFVDNVNDIAATIKPKLKKKSNIASPLTGSYMVGSTLGSTLGNPPPELTKVFGEVRLDMLYDMLKNSFTDTHDYLREYSSHILNHCDMGVILSSYAVKKGIDNLTEQVSRLCEILTRR